MTTSSKNGGARSNAGRPKGSGSKITADKLLASIHQLGHADYVDLLAQDFLAARARGDWHLVFRYHNLILNRVLTTPSQLTLITQEDRLPQQQQNFAQALAQVLSTGDSLH